MVNEAEFALHSHHFVSGPRSNSGVGKDGEWHTGSEKIEHSHPGGSIPHAHPQTGPSFYGYRARSFTKKPRGEQGLEVIPRTEEELTFEVIVLDSALVSTLHDGLQPIGDTPVEALGFPAADTIMRGFGMKCVVRDERTGKLRA